MSDSSDRTWGRLAGARPPLSPRTPLLAFALAAAVLSVVVVAVVRDPGALDDPDPGHQRPGFLIDGPRLEGVALPGRPLGRQPVLLVFDRRLPPADAFAAFLADVPDSVAAVVVVPDRGDAQASAPPAAHVVVDPAGRLARRVGLRRPKGGGSPVGYALVDRSAQVRYATLDPTYLEHAFEVNTVAEALP